jgi:hypothetical protein
VEKKPCQCCKKEFKFESVTLKTNLKTRTKAKTRISFFGESSLSTWSDVPLVCEPVWLCLYHLNSMVSYQAFQKILGI